jgi:protein involved in polysaccharide export with SLBB domain
MDDQKIKALRDLIHSAQNSISSAKKILNSILWEDGDWGMELSTDGLSSYQEGDEKIIEGVFTGDSMLGSDGNIYPVPQNYSSKSLLVQGSKLKAIIQPNGKIVYKIIGEIPYESKLGIVTKNWEKYSITTDTKTYNVLLAAVTFHHCDVGDTVSIRIPEWKDATYAVIESVVPKK